MPVGRWLRHIAVCPHLMKIDEFRQDFETLMKEDMAVTALVQKGYASGGYEPGIANQLEDRILHQQALNQRFLLGD